MRLERIAISGVDAILLREKDLSVSEYTTLTLQCQKICEAHHVRLILNSFFSIACDMQLPVQLSMHAFSELSLEQRQRSPAIGVSIHGTAEALQAQELGADWLIAGHIFPTACKAGLPPRGLQFLQEVCTCTQIPVYAIGGIALSNLDGIRNAGASGGCVMSEWMQCANPQEQIQKWKKQLHH